MQDVSLKFQSPKLQPPMGVFPQLLGHSRSTQHSIQPAWFKAMRPAAWHKTDICCYYMCYYIEDGVLLNSLRPRQNKRHFADDIFKCNFLNENVWIPIKISLEFVPKGPINNIPPLVQIMAWRRPGDKPLSEPMMVKLPTHICVTGPQWVNTNKPLI